MERYFALPAAGVGAREGIGVNKQQQSKVKVKGKGKPTAEPAALPGKAQGIERYLEKMECPSKRSLVVEAEVAGEQKRGRYQLRQGTGRRVAYSEPRREVGQLQSVPGFEHERVGTAVSGIAGAGLGLFARAVFTGGQWICSYTGEEVSQRQVEREDYVSDYCVRREDGVIIDARREGTGPGKFANDSGAEHMNNSELKTGSKGFGVYALHDELVKTGQEVFVSYGGPYFVHAKFPLELRLAFSKWYPECAYRLLHIAGEGECEHLECIAVRAKVMRYWERVESELPLPAMVRERNVKCRQSEDWREEWRMCVDGEAARASGRLEARSGRRWRYPRRFSVVCCDHVVCRRHAMRDLTMLARRKERACCGELALNKRCREELVEDAVVLDGRNVKRACVSSSCRVGVG